MQFSTILATAASFFAVQAVAAPGPYVPGPDAEGAGKNFTLVSIRSASPVHLLPITQSDDKLYVGGNGTSVAFTLQKDGTLKTIESQKNVALATPDYDFDLVEVGAISRFSLKDHELKNDLYQFYACPTGEDGYQLFAKSCADGYGISLYYSEISN